MDGESALDLGLNRNKESMVVDLTQTESRDVFRALVAMADVVVIDMLPVERQAYYLQTSLMAANLALQATRIAEYHAGGQQPPRMGHAISYHVPHQTFATQTHWIAVAVHTVTQCHF